ncbi:MAG: hypothetical protein HC869_19305 [Rhodospirillales bacterium]|nr:hypothetical protein [Rhodospirillales bacterium]
MRILMLCLGLIMGLLSAAPASAQGFPPGPWRGTWTGGTPGFEYQAELNFTIENSGRVEGKFTWMLVQSPRHEDQAKIGLRADEYVEGAFDPQTGALNLRTTRIDDANGIIGEDVYRLAVAPNGSFIAGITENGGTWQGRLDLRRFGPS